MAQFAQKPVARLQATVEHCHRCGGLMVQEKVFELGLFDWRCVSCGDRVDPIILAHRQTVRTHNPAREQAEKLFAGVGKPRSN